MLEYADLHDVTLVAHSFGGLIITGVAEQVPERLARLVYLDAMVPEDGQSNYDFWDATTKASAPSIGEGVAAGWPGFEVVYPGVEDFHAGMTKDPADADWLVSKFTPHPLAASSQPIQLGNPAAAALPRAYIFCTEEKGTADEDPLTRIAERLRSDPAWSFQEIAANHMALSTTRRPPPRRSCRWYKPCPGGPPRDGRGPLMIDAMFRLQDRHGGDCKDFRRCVMRRFSVLLSAVVVAAQ